jgi:hypothetical protein
MRVLLAATLLVCCPALGFAQNQGEENLCNPASATKVDRDAGVTVQNVTLSGKWGSNEATVYFPDKETADAAVVFSHSATRSDSGASVDLLPLALTLARAGAAVEVPRRTLTWPPTDRSTNRAGAVVFCAEQWLVDNTKAFNDENIVVRSDYAYVGPTLCDPWKTAALSARLCRSTVVLVASRSTVVNRRYMFPLATMAVTAH